MGKKGKKKGGAIAIERNDAGCVEVVDQQQTLTTQKKKDNEAIEENTIESISENQQEQLLTLDASKVEAVSSSSSMPPVGSPPQEGKDGEEALNECMINFGGFDHNVQTIRILTLLENKYYNFPGLNLTIETLDGLIKHNGPVYDETKFKNILGSNIFKNKINYKLNPSLESQISTISDDIAYNSHDLEDGLKAKLFSIYDLQDLPVISKIIRKHRKKLKTKDIELVLRQIIREIINVMVSDLVNNIKRNIKIFKPKNINDIYKSNDNYVNFSDDLMNFDYNIKEFLKDKMYNNKNVLKKTLKGKKIIIFLFSKIRKNPKRFIKRKLLKTSINKERAVCDFIAGMTDRYAINLFNLLK